MNTNRMLFVWSIFVFIIVISKTQKPTSNENQRRLPHTQPEDTEITEEQLETTTLEYTVKQRNSRRPPQGNGQDSADSSTVRKGQTSNEKSTQKQIVGHVVDSEAESDKQQTENIDHRINIQNINNKTKTNAVSKHNENTGNSRETSKTSASGTTIVDNVESEFSPHTTGEFPKINSASNTNLATSGLPKHVEETGETNGDGQVPIDNRKRVQQLSNDKQSRQPSDSKESIPTEGFHILTALPDDSGFFNPTPSRRSSNSATPKSHTVKLSETAEEAEESDTTEFYVLTGIPDDLEPRISEKSSSKISKSSVSLDSETTSVSPVEPDVQNDATRKTISSQRISQNRNNQNENADASNPTGHATTLSADEESKLVATDADFGKAVNNKFNEIIRNLSAIGALTEKDLVSERIIKNISDAFAHLIENGLLNRDSSEPLSDVERDAILDENARKIIQAFINSRKSTIITDKSHGPIIDLVDLVTTTLSSITDSDRQSNVDFTGKSVKVSSSKTVSKLSTNLDEEDASLTTRKLDVSDGSHKPLQQKALTVTPSKNVKSEILSTKPIQSHAARIRPQLGDSEDGDTIDQYETSHLPFDIITHSTNLENVGVPKNSNIHEVSESSVIFNSKERTQSGSLNFAVTKKNEYTASSNSEASIEKDPEESEITEIVSEATQSSRLFSKTTDNINIEKLFGKKSQTPEVKFQIGAESAKQDTSDIVSLFTDRNAVETTEIERTDENGHIATHFILRDPLTPKPGNTWGDGSGSIYPPSLKNIFGSGVETTSKFPEPFDWNYTEGNSRPTISSFVKSNTKPFDSHENVEETTEDYLDNNGTEKTSLIEATKFGSEFGSHETSTVPSAFSKKESTLNFVITPIPIQIVDTSVNKNFTALPTSQPYTYSSLSFFVQNINTISGGNFESNETTQSSNKKQEFTEQSGLFSPNYVTDAVNNFSISGISEIPLEGEEFTGPHSNAVTLPNENYTELIKNESSDITSSTLPASFGSEWTKTSQSSVSNTSESSPLAEPGPVTNSSFSLWENSSLIPEPEWTKPSSNLTSQKPPVPEPEWTKNFTFGSELVTKAMATNFAITTWSFKFLELEWDPEYNDKSTWKYQDLHKKILPDVNKYFKASLKDKFVEASIKNFLAGSVVVNGQVETTEKVDSAQLQDDFRGQVREQNYLIGSYKVDTASIKVEGFGDIAQQQTDVKIVPSPSTTSKGGVPGYVIGIIVAVIILALVVIGVALYMRRYRGRRSEENYMASNVQNGNGTSAKTTLPQQQQQQRPLPTNGRDNYAGVNLYEMKDTPARGAAPQGQVNQGYQTDGRTNGYSGKGETKFQSLDEHAINFDDDDE